MRSPNDPATRLETILKGEKWHVNTGNWIGDAIYGMNDGLTAVFGIVSGMAGFTGNSFKHVIAAGLMATLASALSMGSSAFLATKAEREVYEAEMERERREIEESPDHEREELALIYQLKGLTEEESRKMAATISAHPDTFLRTMASEELGLSDRNFPNPWVSMLSGTISTAVGGMVPVLPFLVARGTAAIVASAVVSTFAHFAVGAAKTLVTNRPWFASGLEMTVVGVGMGAITYFLGVVFQIG
jgi:VIT1/CCC1 family predicted Fe2+/Mn2+ transporter